MNVTQMVNLTSQRQKLLKTSQDGLKLHQNLTFPKQQLLRQILNQQLQIMYTIMILENPIQL